MKNCQIKLLLLMLALCVSLSMFHSNANAIMIYTGSTYDEGSFYPDAGDLSNPTYLPVLSSGQWWSKITGSVGPNDQVDAFTFYWSGGNFVLSIQNTADPGSAGGLRFSVYTPMYTWGPSPELKPGDSNGLNATYFQPGDYTLAIVYDSADPPYVVDFGSDDGGLVLGLPTVPEPSTLIFFGGGLLGLVAAKFKFWKA